MADSAFEFSVFDSDNGTRRNSTNSTKPLHNPTENGNGHVTFKMSTVYVIATLAAAVLVGNGLFMYLIANIKHDCNLHLPENFKPSMQKGSNGDGNPTRPATTTTTTVSAGCQGSASSANVGCPVGWLRKDQSCYFFGNESWTWLDAMMECKRQGSYLVEVNTPREDQFLRAQAQHIGVIGCYNQTSKQYNGRRNTTFEGWQCQRWDSQSPHGHTRNNVLHFPETSLTDANNYCRDPDGEGLPWCYTTNPDVRWQFCGVYRCPGDFWIGMADQTKGNPWIWVNSASTISHNTYSNWGPGEPSNKALKYEHCGALNATIRLAWSDRNCFWPAFYICEKNSA